MLLLTVYASKTGQPAAPPSAKESQLTLGLVEGEKNEGTVGVEVLVLEQRVQEVLEPCTSKVDRRVVSLQAREKWSASSPSFGASALTSFTRFGVMKDH